MLLLTGDLGFPGQVPGQGGSLEVPIVLRMALPLCFGGSVTEWHDGLRAVRPTVQSRSTDSWDAGCQPLCRQRSRAACCRRLAALSAGCREPRVETKPRHPAF